MTDMVCENCGFVALRGTTVKLDEERRMLCPECGGVLE